MAARARHGTRAAGRSVRQRREAEGGAATTAGATTTAGGGAHDGRGRRCHDYAAGGGAARSSRKDTGKVTLLSAGEPEEVAAYQKIFDDLINSKTDYKAEVVSAGDFEQQFQIQAAGGTLDVAAAPQPGAIPALVDKGEIVALEDLGFNIDELNDAASASPSWRSASTTGSTTASRPTSTSRA